MKGEINRNYYCSLVADGKPCVFSPCSNTYCGCQGFIKTSCPHLHRKWPTPEQFLEEYGEEYPDWSALYARYKHLPEEWKLFYMSKDVKRTDEDNMAIICACTPWGKPPADWRTE